MNAIHTASLNEEVFVAIQGFLRFSIFPALVNALSQSIFSMLAITCLTINGKVLVTAQ